MAKKSKGKKKLPKVPKLPPKKFSDVVEKVGGWKSMRKESQRKNK